MKNKMDRRFYLSCGILMLTSEIWKQWTLTYILNNGHYNWWYFPFQLCSVPMYLCLLIPFVHTDRIRRIFLTFLMDFGLLGGIFAFFDTSGMHYGYAPLTLHSYLWHVLLILLGIYTGLGGYRGISEASAFLSDDSFAGYLGSTCCYLVCCGVATIFNLAFHAYGKINMFYISPHYWMGQKVFREIAHSAGNRIGILSYILATITGAGLLHLFWHQLRLHIKK